jgi:hypothetical protein
MTAWKKILVAASTGVTLVVMATVAASASGTGRDALRAAGTRAVLMASTSPGNGAAPRGGGTASGGGLGPIQISIGKTWTLDVQLIVSGTITVTCGPFMSPNGAGSAQVTVEEALGGKVGHATANVVLNCDGAKHTYPVSALVSDVPFTTGSGAVGVTAQASGLDTSFQFVGQQGSAVSAITVK